MPESDPPITQFCDVCGTRLRVAGSPCPLCLLSLATDSPFDDAVSVGPLTNQRWGDYDLLEEISRGGMGVVYRARQVSLQREVAIKLILSGEMASKEARAMFHTEALAAAGLHHGNIVSIYEAGEHDLQPYLAMRLVPGGRNIAQWAGEHRKDFRAIATAVAQVARAVAHAHERGVLHRDLKPSNILWDAEHGPQVTDFGLAKLLDAADGTLTVSGVMLGSPSYMAPEQTGGRLQEVTTTTDIYGIGAVLYELLAGRPPFVGKSVIDIARQVAEDAPPPLTEVPLDLHTVCLKCLAKTPTDRYASAAMLAEDLERFSRGEPVSAVPLAPAARVWRWAQRRPAMAALLVACLTLFISGVGGIVWQWRKTEQARAAQEKSLAHLQWQEIGRWLDEGQTSRALAYLASLIRERPDRWQAVMYAMSIVEQHSFPVQAGPEILPPSKLTAPAMLAPDGTWLAAAGEDRMVRLWDGASGRETAQLPQPSPVAALAVSGGPIALAVALADGTLQLYPSPAEPAQVLPRQGTGPVLELRFSADGSHLLALFRERIEVWLTQGPTPTAPAFTLEGAWKGVDLTADGSRFLAWNAKEAVVCETATGANLLRVETADQFRNGSLGAGGSRVALIESEFVARIWDVASRRAVREIASSLTVLQKVSIDLTGTRVTLSGHSHELAVYDADSGLPVSPPMQHHYDVTQLVSSRDGRSVLSCGGDGFAMLWDARTGQRLLNPFWLGASRTSIHVSLSHDARRVLVQRSMSDGPRSAIQVWRGSRKVDPERHHVEGQRDFNSSSLSPDGRLAALGIYPDVRCRIYETATGRVVLDAPTEGQVYVTLFSPDARKCYALTANGWLHGWSLETGAPLWQPHQQPGMIRPGALSPDGTRIIAGHNDGHIRIYDTARGALVRTLDHPGEVKLLRFAPDGSGRFLSASTDRLAHLWDLRTGAKLRTFAGHAHTIIAGAWSRDSRYVATASYDTTARVWDAGTGQPVGLPMAHLGELSHLEFSPDGTRLATASRDGTARLWDPRTGTPASAPLPQGRTCLTVRFTADGATLLVNDLSGFRFWDTATAEPVSIHYHEPMSGGLGMDSENWRAIVNRDGSQVFLGYSMNYGALWSIPQPRTRAPVWLPEFLEMLAQMRIDEHGEIRLVPQRSLNQIESQITLTEPANPYAAWARRVLSEAAKEDRSVGTGE